MCETARPDGSLYVQYLAIELRSIIGHYFLSNIYLFQLTSIGGSRVQHTMTGAVSKSMATIGSIIQESQTQKMSVFRGDENRVSEIEAKLGPRKLLDILSYKLAWPRGNHLPSLAETPPAWISGTTNETTACPPTACKTRRVIDEKWSGPGSVGHITTSSAGDSEQVSN
jgi:hypothetical protein